MVSKTWLIFNPASGQGEAEQELALIRACLDPEMDLKLCCTQAPQDAATFAREGIEAGADCLIAAGGDGTISAVMAAALDARVPVGILPRGTANTFAKALAIPEDLEGACEAILHGEVRRIDVARLANGRVMLSWAGVGLGAEAIVHTQTDSKARLGRMAYLLSGLQQLQTLEHFYVEVETESRIAIASAAAVTVANAAPPSSVLAQGSPEVCPDDGWLDVTIFAPQSSAEALAASYDLWWAGVGDRATRRSDVSYLRAKSVKVRTDPPQNVVVDGEIVGRHVLEVDCLTRRLMVLAPPAPSLAAAESSTVPSNP